MSLWEQFKWSFRHSKRQPLESLLVVLTIALGVGVIIAVLGLFLSVGSQYRDIEQAQHFRMLELLSKSESARRDGAPLTLIGSQDESGEWSATLEELAEFQRNLPSTMHAYVETHWSARTPLLPENEESDEEFPGWYFDANQLFIMGTTPEYFAFNESVLQSGNFFLPDDVMNRSNVIVLPVHLATELFGDSDPLGQVIPLLPFGDEESVDYTVIGVLAPSEAEEDLPFRLGGSRMCYAPVTATPFYREARGGMSFQNITVGLDKGTDIATALERATSEAHLVWGELVAVRSSLAEFRESQKQMQRYALLIGVLASVGLVIAVINILNLMLARVLKRTKSIGLSMALGSSRPMVFRQFMMEALTLGMAGSIFGVALSFALVEVLRKALGAFFSTGVLGTRVLMGVAIGFVASLVFGVYPAYLGSKTDPVDALRTD